jgi:hypothetical protein
LYSEESPIENPMLAEDDAGEVNTVFFAARS